MSDFIFRVEDYSLTKEQEHLIAGAIRATVLSELAKLDLSSNKPAARAAVISNEALLIPIKWQGGILLNALKAADFNNKVLGVQLKEAAGQG